MARLEDIVTGACVRGLVLNQSVTIESVKWHGSNVLSVTYREQNGRLNETLLYRFQEIDLSVEKEHLPWSFDADADMFRLVSEAYRIRLAHLFDPYLAIHTSSVEPLPHQISAVYEEMLPRLPLRFLLADDPGAGKTIMTGLLLKELVARGDLKRCLIVSPGSLAEQWQDELYQKFHLHFTILSNDILESAVTGNAMLENNFCIARLDKLARNEHIQEKLKVAEWDLVVVDEAHKMSASVWGGEVRYTKRFQLGRLLSNTTRHLLLLTATPHNGKEEDFQLFMSLLDPDRFEGVVRNSQQSIDVSDVMRRLVKEDLLKFDGKPLFPERQAATIRYDLSDLEAKLYQQVSDYVREEFNRADKLSGERKNTIGFALTVLQRRLASSPEAIYQSLHRRRERLESRLGEERLGKRVSELHSDTGRDDFDEDELSAGDLEEIEDSVTDQASAAATIAELEAEIVTLKSLEYLADEVRRSGDDRKWKELSSLLQNNELMYTESGAREKIIIFTEHRDTLRYLEQKISTLLGDAEAVKTIHGGMLRDERRKVEELFKQDKGVRILIATDAAGEGLNLQRAHLMVNYDLPWNPNKIEQRFGRIHRIGQKEVCHLWNIVAKDTREGDVFLRLFHKLEEERLALGGKVFDILGKVLFDNKPLKELLIEAIRYGNDPKVRARLDEVVENAMDQNHLCELLLEHALSADSMDLSKVLKVREEMELWELRKLQPHFISSFFLDAFKHFGGRISQRESSRYEITRVPQIVQQRDIQIGSGVPILKSYERICFDKTNVAYAGKANADLVSPGHPLLDAVIDLLMEKHVSLMKQGCIFIDDRDWGCEPRLLCYIEHFIQDGVMLSNDMKRVVSKQVHFVELFADNSVRAVKYAPYLDYRAPSTEEKSAVLAHLPEWSWLSRNVEGTAVDYAIEHIAAEHYRSVSQQRIAQVDKAKNAVKVRLTGELQYWDARANELKEKEAAGKSNSKINSTMARRRADELEERMRKRLAELDLEKQLFNSLPHVSGGAIVIPRGLLAQWHLAIPPTDLASKKETEAIAMHTVMEYERSLGYEPEDVSHLNCGYDVCSYVPEHLRQSDEPSRRFIEVKGRHDEAKDVTVSKNEILTALNSVENYYLALVLVADGRAVNMAYLQKPFQISPEFSATFVTFDIEKLISSSKRCLLDLPLG